MPLHRLYADLAPWWLVLSPPADRRAEAAQIQRWLRSPASILELGSGAGQLARMFDAEVVLVDRSEAMVAVSRTLQPERTHHVADLCTLDLERTFDAVVLHDAVMYLTEPGQLEAAFATAARHLRPGGRFVVLPDFVADGFEEHLVSGSRTAGARTAAMMEWHWDPDPDDATVQVDFSLLLREGARMTAVHEAHTMALHPRQGLVDALRAAGFAMIEVPWDDLRDEGEVFLAERT
jgi:SAM-dependent methyltransferase